MFCVKCGKEIENNAKYCKFCGNQVTKEQNNTGTHVKVGHRWLVAIIFVMFGVAAFLVVMKMSTKDNNASISNREDVENTDVKGDKEETFVHKEYSEVEEIVESPDISTETSSLTDLDDHLDYDEIYSPILDKCMDIISEDDYEVTDEGYEMINNFAMLNHDSVSKYCDIGYSIKDFSGDGIPELIIGYYNANRKGQVYIDIYALYTISDGKPYLTFEGLERDRYKFIDDGTFCNIGSAGAAENYFGDFALSEDGKSIIWNDFYFSVPSEYDIDDVRFYRNSNGTCDLSVSKELNRETGEFDNAYEYYLENYMTFDASSLDEYLVEYMKKGKSIRACYTLMDMNKLAKRDGYYVLKGSFAGGLEFDLVIDKYTEFDKTCDTSFFGYTYTQGDTPYEWCAKCYDAFWEADVSGSGEINPFIGVFDVKITNGHIDSYYGAYWWD